MGRTVFPPSQDPSPIPGHVLRGGGGGICWFLVVVSDLRAAVGVGVGGGGGLPGAGVPPPPLPPALTCTEFSCHSALTFHLLGTEQKRCWDFFFFFFLIFQKVVGLLSVLKITKKKLPTVVKSSPKRAPPPRHSVNRCRNLIL